MQFRVKRANSLEEVRQILLEEPDACLIAGGTDRIPRVTQKIESYPLYILLDGIPGLKGIRQTEDGGYVIGAMTTLTEIAEAPLAAGANALACAASKVASPQIRNQGTIGGNLLQENRCIYFNQSVSWRRAECCFKLGGDRCYQYRGSKECVALLQSDTAPALMALGGTVILEGARGRRETAVDDLYLNRGRNNKAVEKDEVLVEVRIPSLEHVRSAYVRETIRGSIDFPLISCAAAFRMEGDVIAEAKVVIGSAGPRPSHAEASEQLLQGKRLSEAAELLPEVVEKAKTKILPFRDSRVDGPARKALGGSAIQRAIEQLL